MRKVRKNKRYIKNSIFNQIGVQEEIKEKGLGIRNNRTLVHCEERQLSDRKARECIGVAIVPTSSHILVTF